MDLQARCPSPDADELPPQQLQPTLHKLETEYACAAPTAEQAESYRSLLALGKGRWLIGYGSGSLYRCHVTRNDAGAWIARYEQGWHVDVPIASAGARWRKEAKEEGEVGPISFISATTLAEASLNGDAQLYVLIRRARRVALDSTAPSTKSTTVPKRRTMFDVAMLRLPVYDKAAEAKDALPTLSSQWSLVSEEAPYHSYIDSSGMAYLVGEAPLTSSLSTQLEPESSTAGPSSAPSAPTEAAASSAPVQRRLPPYAWTQTSDTVTLAFSLPVYLTTSMVRAHFSPRGLSLTLSPASAPGPSNPDASITQLSDDATQATLEADDAATHANREHAEVVAESLRAGAYAARRTWDDIDANGSVWTIERVKPSVPGGKETSLLSLHLEKKHAGTRWTAVFAPRDAEMEDAEEEDFDDEEVPETLDPTELLAQLEGLEKYTAAPGLNEAQTRALGATWSGESGGGGGPALSTQHDSLLHDGLEAEDAQVGRTAIVTQVIQRTAGSVDDALQLRTSATHATLATEKALAVPLPTAAVGRRGALVLKPQGELDGQLFEPPHNASTWKWAHEVTFPALAFVLASKRDAQRVLLHTSPEGASVVLAFEGASNPTAAARQGTSSDAGSLFVYCAPREPKAQHALSHVIQLGARATQGVSSGSLIGAAALALGGKQVLLCLCERQLLVLTDLL